MRTAFFMVKGAGPTNVIHSSREVAEREARRLASLNPGERFFVLQAVTSFHKADVEREDLVEAGADGLPF